MNTLFRAMIVIAIVCAGWLYVDNANRQERAAARRTLDERSAALLARTIAPGSALSCLSGLSGDAIEAACEKTVFASPEAVSAAVSYVTAELDLLIDGAIYAGRFDQAYFSQIGQLQSILQRDRFGIVAYVFAMRGCTVEKCDSGSVMGDPSRMLANLRDHVFEANVMKFATAWSTGHSAAANAGADGATARPAAAVSSQYDFPSANSIPPVNIMVPEPAPRSAASPAGAPPRQAAAPVPPRRPPPGRAPPLHPVRPWRSARRLPTAPGRRRRNRPRSGVSPPLRADGQPAKACSYSPWKTSGGISSSPPG
jgi:hypothetical protein